MFSFMPRGASGWRACCAVTRELSKAEAEKKLVTEDAVRAAYVRDQFGEDWQNRHLYHLMMSSSLGEKEAVSIILSALHCAKETQGGVQSGQTPMKQSDSREHGRTERPTPGWSPSR